MIFGSTFSGHVKTQSGQCVESKVIAFVIPIAVPYSFLVTEVTGNGRRGMELKVLPVSVVAILLRVVATILTFFSVAVYLANDDMSWLLPVAVVMAFLAYLAWFKFGKTKPEEMLIRQSLLHTTGFAVLPEWLKGNDLQNFHRALSTHYKETLQGKDVEGLNEQQLYSLLAFRSLEKAVNKEKEPHAEMVRVQELLQPNYVFSKKA